MMAIGGMLGALIGLSLVLYVNLPILIITTILVSGLVGFARLQLKEHTPDLIITELYIVSSSSDIEGEELIQRIRELNTTAKIIIITTYYDHIVKHKMEEYYIHSYITKPFTLEDLISSVYSALSIEEPKDSNL